MQIIFIVWWFISPGLSGSQNNREVKMDKEEFKKLKERVYEGLSINCKPTQNLFWYGFIVSLYDYHVISFEQYREISIDIEYWKKQSIKQ